MNIDFGELLVATVAVSSVRLLTAMTCELDIDLCHFDIEEALVQSDHVCMYLPQGCGRMSGKTVRLKKSSYCLKQASRQWHAFHTRCLLSLGFVHCLADACVFG